MNEVPRSLQPVSSPLKTTLPPLHHLQIAELTYRSSMARMGRVLVPEVTEGSGHPGLLVTTFSSETRHEDSFGPRATTPFEAHRLQLERSMTKEIETV
jgi:hypothetical protein